MVIIGICNYTGWLSTFNALLNDYPIKSSPLIMTYRPNSWEDYATFTLEVYDIWNLVVHFGTSENMGISIL